MIYIARIKIPALISNYMPNGNDYIGEKIVSLHGELMKAFPDLSRLAIAIYDRENDQLKTFVNSTKKHEPLRNYSACLSETPSLKILAESKQVRVIEDLTTLKNSPSAHTQWLINEGFRSSYTIPMYGHEQLIGFLFFDADKPRYFDQIIVKSLDVYAELITSVLVNELSTIYTLRGALNTARHLTHHRDNETASHLTRMSHYSNLLAQKLAGKHQLGDDYIEFVFQYSPLHDIGKIGISDQILLKPGKLTDEEFDIIRTHVDIGAQIIESILKEFELAELSHVTVLKNIICCHHERFNGSGYPYQLKGTDIPLEGRIVAVADVLDALSHPRPYKKAWSFDHAVDYIVERSGDDFDPDCCDILGQHKEQFRDIFQSFAEDR